MKVVRARVVCCHPFLIGMLSCYCPLSTSAHKLTRVGRLDWWAKRNGCSAENPQVDTVNNIVHLRTWNCSGSPHLLQHYLVDDMGEHLGRTLATVY